jgi:glucokinase
MIRELVDNPLAIGVGSIGPLNYKDGMIINTPNYPFKEIPIVEPLKRVFETPIEMVNDCSAGVLGEYVFGAGKGIENLFYVTMSTGIGGGAIVDGHLLKGKDGNAVEIGHLTIYPDSELICGCGCPGHWEAFSGGKNIPRYVRVLLKDTGWKRGNLYKLCGGNPENITAKMVFDAANQGDYHALRVVEQIGKVNAIGFADIVNAYDPELISIGGSIALHNQELVLTPIVQNIPKHVINRIPKITLTSLGEDVVLYGALALALGEE